jgi:hypothetical protein
MIRVKKAYESFTATMVFTSDYDTSGSNYHIKRRRHQGEEESRRFWQALASY